MEAFFRRWVRGYLFVSDSVLVLLVDKLLAEEWFFAHAEPELTVEVAFTCPIQVLKEAFGALFHHLFELVCALALLSRCVRRLQQAQLVHEECWQANFDRFRVCYDLANHAGSRLLLWVPGHLLETLLNEAGQEDQATIASALNLVILEKDVSAVQLDGLINDVMCGNIRIVSIFGSDGQNGNATSFLNLLIIEL